MTHAYEAALRDAGFEPPYNVCAACKHDGGDHDPNNRCLIDGDYFSSMTDDERWEHGIANLAARGWVLLDVGPIAPRVVAAYHPPDGHNAGQGEWQTDAEGYVIEPLVNEGTLRG